MSAVEVLQVNVLNNPGFFRDPFCFEITYEVREALQQGGSRCCCYCSFSSSLSPL